MFWRFGGYANISTIDTILDKPDFTLEDLLEEGDLIQELKQHNAKLVEYLREQPVLEKLLEYVVAPKLEPVATPDEEDDGSDAKEKSQASPLSRPRGSSRAADGDGAEEEGEKKRNRYAYVAAEILSSDNWSIYEALMESKHLLRNFWQFLKRPTPLDPLQASYFTKVNESLFDKKTEEMLDLLKSLDNAIPDMIKHVDSPMVMDLLLKIISLERTDSGQGVVEWLYTQDVMPTLLSFLGPEHSWATQTSAGDFMKAIITVSANASQNEQTCIGPNELTRQLVSKPCVEQLIQYMLGGGNPLTVGVGIIIEVIRKNNSDYDPEVGQEQNTAPPSSRDPIYLGTLLRRFADHVPDFMGLIMNAPAQKDRLASTFGDKIEPLGFDRFKTCELMAELLHCSNMGLLNEVGAEEIITARDTERQRLRTEGRLVFAANSAPSSAEDLTMRSVARSSSPEESRKLGVTNVSTDDEGFEEITHATEEDSSHESVQADEDMPMPSLPDVPMQSPTTSFLDKDEDFVDEPLSSPRLHVREMEKMDDNDSFEDPDLVVPPLSPTKKNKPAEASTLTTAGTIATEEIDDMIANTTLEDSKEGGGKVEHDVKPATSEADHPMEGDSLTSQESSGVEELAPRPEDTPAPLFSSSAAATESKPLGEEDATTSSGDLEVGDVSTQKAASAEKEADQSEASIIVGHSTEQEASTSTSASDKSPTPPVVGDYLKTQFVENGVVPTILSFFFKYPWNNFLHNVVYDIVQQVFNGPMDRGYNSVLAISLFEAADITAQIIKGQQASELSQARTKTRMGYMGHLTLIAEEVVKFTDRHPPELLSGSVLDRVMAPDWCSYVDGALAETRERDNAILGGMRPEVAMNRSGAGASGLATAGLANIGLSGPQSASSALAEAGLDGGSSAGPFAISAGTLMSGFGSSSDEDDDEEQDNEEDVQNEVSVLSYPRVRPGLVRVLSGIFRPRSPSPPPPPFSSGESSSSSQQDPTPRGLGSWFGSLLGQESMDDDEFEFPNYGFMEHLPPPCPGDATDLQDRQDSKGSGPGSIQSDADHEFGEDAELDSDILDLLADVSPDDDNSGIESSAANDIEEIKYVLESLGLNHAFARATCSHRGV